MKYRIKKKCLKCGFLAVFPYVHCVIGCKLKFEKTQNISIVKPLTPTKCRNARNAYVGNI